MIKPWDYQLELSDIALDILKQYGLVYLAMEERTGKTLTAILVCEECNVSKILVITKKKAVDGWEKTLNNYIHLHSYTVTTYHQLHKLQGDYGLIILDEAHENISGYPKTSKLWDKVHKFCKDKPIIYLSATPHAQGPQLLYHQLKLSSWSPWSKFKDFYSWFKHFAQRDEAGQLKMKHINAHKQVIDYTAIQADEALAQVAHLFVTYTRAQAGFEHEPEDVLHYIELSEVTRAVYNQLLKHKLLDFTHAETGIDYKLVCDTPMKLRTALHMLEGGGLKIDEKAVALGNSEKIDYIKETWGDTEDIAIMYQYHSDLARLEKAFKHARLLQAQSYAEGVDLSMYKHLIIYSQNFSTAKHTQRRARQANMNRDEEIKVHFLLVKKAVSEQVYKTVSINKKNFVDSCFERETL